MKIAKSSGFTLGNILEMETMLFRNQQNVYSLFFCLLTLGVFASDAANLISEPYICFESLNICFWSPIFTFRNQYLLLEANICCFMYDLGTCTGGWHLGSESKFWAPKANILASKSKFQPSEGSQSDSQILCSERKYLTSKANFHSPRQMRPKPKSKFKVNEKQIVLISKK